MPILELGHTDETTCHLYAFNHLKEHWQGRKRGYIYAKDGNGTAFCNTRTYEVYRSAPITRIQ